MNATFCPRCETELADGRCPACDYDASAVAEEPEPDVALTFSEKYRGLAFADGSVPRRRAASGFRRGRVLLAMGVALVLALWASMLVLKELQPFVVP